MKAKQKKDLVSGGIIPMKWNRLGEVMQLGVYTQDDLEIELERNFNPREIQKLMKQRVKVFGNLMGDEFNQKIIKFRIMKQKFAA